MVVAVGAQAVRNLIKRAVLVIKELLLFLFHPLVIQELKPVLVYLLVDQTQF
jgi:hypothetical protein